MAATYNPSRPAALDRIRAALGDTDTTDALLQDEEITAVLASVGSETGAVAQLAAELVVRFAREPGDLTVGSIRLSFADRIQRYRDLAAGGASSAVSTGSVAALNQVVW
jgi:cell division GTPase FtsZ